MPLHLTNTLSRTKERFEPADPEHVTMYVCGPTVYDFAHVGNARPAVVFDLLYRQLRRQFPKVSYARNFTDVDDKINTAAKAAGLPIGEVTARFIAAYHEDMAALGVLTPDYEPRVTDHVPEIIGMIEALIARGNAYAAEGHVLFNVQSFADYGMLSKRSRDDMVAGARVEIAPYKRDPADFVLWKPSTDDLPGWDSPWGRGRPGWHIECSAMIEKHLGHTIDIHGGGQDLIFPHHENEIAQGTCAHGGALYCRTWVHNGFVTVDGAKMSKSLGNIRLVRDMLAEVPGEAIRLALLSAHYRQPLDLNAQTLHEARRTLDRLYGLLRNMSGIAPSHSATRLDPFYAALDDDLNTPAALAELHGLARALRSSNNIEQQAEIKAALLEAGASLGLLQSDPILWFANDNGIADPDDMILSLVEARTAARLRRDFAEADRLRSELGALGVEVEDRIDGSNWKRIA